MQLAPLPLGPNAHVERRYLVVPGTHSSRIHILDTKPDPREPELVKVIDGDEVMRKTGYAAPHTVHGGPDGIYLNALGAPDGNGPGGIFTPKGSVAPAIFEAPATSPGLSSGPLWSDFRSDTPTKGEAARAVTAPPLRVAPPGLEPGLS